MFTEINVQLEQTKEAKRKKHRLEARRKKLTEYHQVEKVKVAQLLQIVEKEEQDVQKLEGLSITNLFYTFLGRKLEKLDQEKQEALAAKLKYDEAVETLQDIKNELLEVELELEDVVNAEEQYKALLMEKERLLHSQGTVWSEELFQLAEQIADVKTDLKEYLEAIEAGRDTLTAIDHAEEALDKAKGWATWDMFGGGMISTAIKHSHINDAKEYIHRVQTKLRHFEEELSDIHQSKNTQVEIGSFLTFADYFFDGFVVDWIVRGRITDSLQQVRDVRSQVNEVLEGLHQNNKQMAERLSHLEIRRKELIETAR